MERFNCWASSSSFHLSDKASNAANSEKGNLNWSNWARCLKTVEVLISVMGKITEMPRCMHSDLIVEINPSGFSPGEGYTNVSPQYWDVPARVLFDSPATTTHTPLLPNERVAASAPRVLPSVMRTFAFMVLELMLCSFSTDLNETYF